MVVNGAPVGLQSCPPTKPAGANSSLYQLSIQVAFLFQAKDRYLASAKSFCTMDTPDKTWYHLYNHKGRNAIMKKIITIIIGVVIVIIGILVIVNGMFF